RAQADALGVDPEKIGFVGFSAGGHLAGFVATECPKEAAPVSCRPDFIVMVYPVVTLDDRWAHGRSKRSMLGSEPETPELVEQLSLERRVTAQTPPAMLVHSRHDKKVMFKNSELYDEAARAVGAPSSLHLYD